MSSGVRRCKFSDFLCVRTRIVGKLDLESMIGVKLDGSDSDFK